MSTISSQKQKHDNSVFRGVKKNNKPYKLQSKYSNRIAE